MHEVEARDQPEAAQGIEVDMKMGTVWNGGELINVGRVSFESADKPTRA